MAINNLNSKFTDSLGTNTLTRGAYIVAGVAGAGAFALGAFNLAKGMGWDTLHATAALTGGTLLSYGVVNKVRYQEDVTYRQTRHISMIVGSFLVGAAAIPYVTDVFSSESDSAVTSSTVDETQITQPGITIISNPPGMCEISIPYKSSDTPGVVKMQTALYNEGYYPGPIDGINGPDTKQSLRAFKTANGFDTSTNFNQQMCEVLSAELVDGIAATPALKVGG